MLSPDVASHAPMTSAYPRILATLFALLLFLALGGSPAVAGLSATVRTEFVSQPYLGISPVFGRWNTAIPWVYNPSHAPAPFTDTDTMVSLIKEAMAEWEGVSGVRFDHRGTDATFQNKDDDGLVAIVWEDIGQSVAGGGPFRFLDRAKTLGYDPYTDGELKINRSYDWTLGGQHTTAMAARALKGLLVHELGHLMGLGHSDNPVSILYADPYNPVRHPLEDDITAARAFYGPSAHPTTVTGYTPPSAGASPLSESFLYLGSSGKDLPVTEITPTTSDADVLYFGARVSDPLTQTLELHVTDASGYLIHEATQTLSCPTGCAYLDHKISAVDILKGIPGQYHLYVTGNGQLWVDHPFTVTATHVWNHPPTASVFSYDASTGTATLVASDPEGDGISATWHIPGQGVVNETGFTGEASRTLTFPTAGEHTVFVALNDTGSRYDGSGRSSPAYAAGAGVQTLLRKVVTVADPLAGAYSIQGTFSGLAKDETLDLFALSDTTGLGGRVTVKGTGDTVAFTLQGLPSLADYRLFVPTTTYVGGYWGGEVGPVASALVNRTVSGLLDLSTGDVSAIHLQVTKGRTLNITLQGMTAETPVAVSAWSETSGMLITAMATTTTEGHATAVLTGVAPVADVLVFVQPDGEVYRSGFYHAPDATPVGFLQATRLDFSAGDQALTLTMEGGRTLRGTLENLPEGERARIQAWSDKTAQGGAVTVTLNGDYTLSGLLAADDYRLCIEVETRASGCYSGSEAVGLVGYSQAKTLDLSSDSLADISLTLQEGRTLSGTVTGFSETDAWVEAFSPSAGHWRTTQVEDDGTFVLQGLQKAGDYRVTVRAEGYKPPVAQTIDLLSETSAITHFNLFRGGRIQGNILGLTAGDVVTVEARSRTTGQGGEITVRATGSAPVPYLLDGLPNAEDVMIGLQTAHGRFFYGANGSTVRGRQQAGTLPPIVEGETVSDIHFDVNGAVSFKIVGRVEGMASLHPHQVVTLTAWSVEDGIFASTHRAGEGAFTLGGLPAGLYYLAVSAPGFVDVFYSLSGPTMAFEHATRLTVTADVENVTVALTEGHTLSGTVYHAGVGVPQASVTVWDNTLKAGGSAVSRLDGTYRIEGLPSGSYQVTAQAQAGREDREGVLVTGPTEQDLLLTLAAGSLRGTAEAGALLMLYGAEGAFVTSTVADSGGLYRFTGLEPGITYRVDGNTDGQLESVAWSGRATPTLATPEIILNLPVPTVFVVMETNLGSITLELDPGNAPISVANFLGYVDAGFYNNQIFHRVIDGFMVQGGLMATDQAARTAQPAIRNEAENGLKNLRGTIAMARTSDIDSATSQFFINLVDNAFLDHTAESFGYAVFGRVTEGMDVVEAIGKIATGSVLIGSRQFDDFPLTTIIILTARRQP